MSVSSPVEHFQDSIRRILNPRIRQHFRDVPLDDDLSTDRGHLKLACLHQDKDSLVLTVGRLLFFILLKLEQIASLIAATLGGGPEDGLKDQYQIRANNLPKITINFSQPDGSVPKGIYPVPAEATFRLVNFVKFKKTGVSGNVPSEAELRVIANRIKIEFENFSFVKGDELYIYKSPLDGFFGTQVYAYSQSEAVRVFRALCRVVQRDFDIDLMSVHVQPAKRSNTKPSGSVETYDGTKKEPRWRPRVKVSFVNAVCDVGLITPVVLVDASGLLANPLVKVR